MRDDVKQKGLDLIAAFGLKALGRPVDRSGPSVNRTGVGGANQFKFTLPESATLPDTSSEILFHTLPRIPFFSCGAAVRRISRSVA